MFIVCDDVCFPEASFRSETCQASLPIKLKSDRAMNYKHLTTNGVAMHSMAPQSIALRSNIMSTRFMNRICVFNLGY
jgi:hypothetical protein